MVSGLEESSRSLTGVRIGWSGLALLLSFTSAIAIAGQHFKGGTLDSKIPWNHKIL